MVDTCQTDGTGPESHRAGSFQHRCLSWKGGGWRQRKSSGRMGEHPINILDSTGSCFFIMRNGMLSKTGLVVSPRNQHGYVMMRWVCVALRVEVLLPSTETGQCAVGMMDYLQPFLQREKQQRK